MASLATCVILAVVSSVALADDTLHEPLTLTFEKFNDYTKRPSDFVPFNKAETCETGKFKGNRFMKPGDPSIILIFDAGDNFVGTQNGLFKEEIDERIVGPRAKEYRNWFDNNPQIVTDETEDMKTIYLMTVYKQDPETVCTFDKPRPNDMLYIVHLEGDKKYLKIDRNNPSALEGEGWTQNSCIPKMGLHYRYQMGGVDWDCLKLTPALLTVHNNRVHGCGFNYPGHYDSPNIENPPYWFMLISFNPPPTCVLEGYNQTRYASQHIYFIEKDRIEGIECP